MFAKVLLTVLAGWAIIWLLKKIAMPSKPKFKSIEDQINVLRNVFPAQMATATADERLAQQSLPLNTHGYLAIPDYRLFGMSYNAAVRSLAELLGCQIYWLEEESICDGLGFNYLRQDNDAQAALKQQIETQGGYNIHIVPIQWVPRHGTIIPTWINPQGKAVGLNVFSLLILSITHPNLIRDLNITATGDKCDPNGMGNFHLTPTLRQSHTGIITINANTANPTTA